jgi:hypothetical protein
MYRKTIEDRKVVVLHELYYQMSKDITSLLTLVKEMEKHIADTNIDGNFIKIIIERIDFHHTNREQYLENIRAFHTHHKRRLSEEIFLAETSDESAEGYQQLSEQLNDLRKRLEESEFEPTEESFINTIMEMKAELNLI